MMMKLAAGASLAVCLAAPFLFFAGRIGEGDYKTALAIASLGWFVFSTRALKRRDGHGRVED